MNVHEPAFPLDELNQQNASNVAAQHFGMTLLDYFAAKVLQARLVSDKNQSMIANISEGKEVLAKDCYATAAAMMEEREKWLK